jgi:hypothetical protein
MQQMRDAADLLDSDRHRRLDECEAALFWWQRGPHVVPLCLHLVDAQFYFKPFFDFSRWFWKQTREVLVSYEFELEGAHFWEVSADGYTVTVWINTTLFPTEEEAQKAWALDTLVAFLKQLPSGFDYRRIY